MVLSVWLETAKTGQEGWALQQAAASTARCVVGGQQRPGAIRLCTCRIGTVQQYKGQQRHPRGSDAGQVRRSRASKSRWHLKCVLPLTCQCPSAARPCPCRSGKISGVKGVRH